MADENDNVIPGANSDETHHIAGEPDSTGGNASFAPADITPVDDNGEGGSGSRDVPADDSSDSTPKRSKKSQLPGASYDEHADQQ